MTEPTATDLERFLAGELQPGMAEWARIIDDLERHPSGFAAQYLDRRTDEAVRRASDRMEEIWERAMRGSLAHTSEYDEELEQALSTGSPEAAEIERYWELSEGDLMSELEQYEEETALAHRGGEDPLEPYLAQLKQFVKVAWNWKERRLTPEFQDNRTVALALAQALADADLPLPFPPQLVAVALVRVGLDRLCDN